jgi:hypothetical protein
MNWSGKNGKCISVPIINFRPYLADHLLHLQLSVTGRASRSQPSHIMITEKSVPFSIVFRSSRWSSHMRLPSFPTPESSPSTCKCFDIEHSYICFIVQLAVNMAWELWQTSYPWDATAWVKFTIWSVTLSAINDMILHLNSLEHTSLMTEAQSLSRT